MNPRLQQADADAAAVSTKFGRNSVVRASTQASLGERRIWVPSAALRYAWGGGLMAELFHLFLGPEHSGKTYVATMVVASVHKLCRNCLREYRTIAYGPVGAGTDYAGFPVGGGAFWVAGGKPLCRPVRHKETKQPGRVVSYYWTTPKKTTMEAWVCTGQGTDSAGRALSGGHAPEFVAARLDDPKSEWEACAEHGVVFEVPYCTCHVEGLPMPYWPHAEKEGAMEPAKDRDERLRRWAQTGNSYDATLALYLDLEGKLNTSWAENQGVDLTRFYTAGFDTAEKAGDVIDAKIRGGLFDVIVVDSIEYLESEGVYEKSFSDGEDRGRAAKLVNAILRKLVISSSATKRWTDRRPTVILINQYRTDASTGRKTTSKGAGQKYAASSTTEFYASDYDATKTQVGRKDEEVQTEVGSLRINFKILKNCGAANRMEGSFELRLKPLASEGKTLVPVGQVNDYGYVYRVARTYGLVEHTDEAWCVDGRSYRTEKELKSYLGADRAAFRRLSDAVVAKMLEAQARPEDF